ncbi:hypothetical protein [Paracoccus cavernae]|uniref:hypothetical protein n=1 Tax=Paracoccus cavernae TaxID=1571207 RepID=UPI00361304B9
MAVRGRLVCYRRKWKCGWILLCRNFFLLSLGCGYRQFAGARVSAADLARCEQLVRDQSANDAEALSLLLPKCRDIGMVAMMDAQASGDDAQAAARRISAANQGDLNAHLLDWAAIGRGWWRCSERQSQDAYAADPEARMSKVPRRIWLMIAMVIIGIAPLASVPRRSLRWEKGHMGQFLMKIIPSTGSRLDGNQQTARGPCG